VHHERKGCWESVKNNALDEWLALGVERAMTYGCVVGKFALNIEIN
jgi:hypothetical protein